MANQQTSPVNGHPAPKLTDQAKKQLEEINKEISFWRSELERAKKIGIDVSPLEQQLNQAAEIKDLLLKHYT